MLAELSLRAVLLPDSSSVVETALEKLQRVIDADMVALFELDPGKEKTALRFGRGWRETSETPFTPPPDGWQRPPDARPAGTHEPARDVPPALTKKGARSGITSPLNRSVENRWFLGAFRSRPVAFGDSDGAVVESVARFLDHVVHRDGTNETLRHAAREGVLGSILHHDPAWIWVTNDRLRVTLTIAFGSLVFDPYQAFLGSTVSAFFGDEEGDGAVVSAHLAALDDQRGVLPIKVAGQNIEAEIEPLRDRNQNIIGCLGIAKKGRPTAAVAEAPGETALLARPVAAPASPIVSIEEDITKRTELEEQLRQAQRMETVGRLAGWVSHDFNNLLTAIIGYTDLMLLDVEDDDRCRADLQAVRNASERAASLTRQLLAFSRRRVLQPQNLDLNAAVRNLEKLLRRLIGEDIELVTKLAEHLGVIRADSGQIEQVLLNLAVNARNAMPDGGRLIIETQNTEFGPSHELVESGRYVMVSVSDTGDGIDKQDLVRIFEPIFSTQDNARGSGLGLSTVYEIVKQSGGYIGACSETLVGTTFKIHLPRVEANLETREPSSLTPKTNGDETVLLVEDEESVRRLAFRILVEHGYEVLEASNGAEALHVSNEHKGSIELMLTDVIMPLMSGPELARRQTTLRPEMKILYMSGYTDEVIVRHGLVGTTTPFLHKPFTRAVLLTSVKSTLSGAMAST